jgi:glycosyltransferase involved in cell wall biosynthesis
MALIKVAIDASRVRSGGGVAHLLGILDISDPKEFGIAEIHVWTYRKLSDRLPQRKWLMLHHPAALEKSLLSQAWWQATELTREINRVGCDILFSADASTFCRHTPMVVLHQNMLAYDEGVLALFGWGKDRFQQSLMYFVQRQAFRFAMGTIFLTQHAARQVQRYVGPLKCSICIPHGAADIFKTNVERPTWPIDGVRPIQCLYVSPVFEYKHQLEVVDAIELLREKGIDIELTLVGGGGKRALNLLNQLLKKKDPNRTYVKVLNFLPSECIVQQFSNADIFVFASSCETFGIALLEAMTSGIPIACSNRSSLPETLGDGGEYFDPEDPQAIADAIECIITNPTRRAEVVEKAKMLSNAYSWRKSARETWRFISDVYAVSATRATR